MKRTMAITLLITALLIQSCDTKNQAKTMYIKSMGEIAVQPDEATITINLECINRDIKKAKSCLIEKSDNLNKTILVHGIKLDDILTTSINQSKEYEWIRNSRVFVGYKLSMTTLLTIHDLKSLENLYTDLLLNENITVGNLSYAHSKMDSLNNVAYQKALENANATADQLLVKMKESAKEIVRIGNIELPEVQQNTEFKYERNVNYSVMPADKSIISINSGTMYVAKSLIVEYGIY